MKKSTARALAALAVALPGIAHACGACIEDKVAATYNHAIVTRAAAKKQLVVFGGIEGANDAAKATARLLVAGHAIKGVQRGTIETSVAPPAFSFALDPDVQTPEGATAELQRRLSTPGVRLTVIRVMR